MRNGEQVAPEVRERDHPSPWAAVMSLVETIGRLQHFPNTAKREPPNANPTLWQPMQNDKDRHKGRSLPSSLNRAGRTRGKSPAVLLNKRAGVRLVPPLRGNEKGRAVGPPFPLAELNPLSGRAELPAKRSAAGRQAGRRASCRHRDRPAR